MANEDKSARYHRLRRRISLLDTIAQAIVLIGILFGGVSAAIRTSVEMTAGMGAAAAALYVIVLAAISEGVHLPFAIARLVLERRYALSRETARRWLVDHVKATAITLVCLTAAGVVVALLLRSIPTYWWLLSSIGFAATLVVIARFAPVWLMPVFYDIRPLDRPALQARLVDLAQKARTPVLGVFEWRLGDRTAKANAALVGIGRTRRVLVSDTLLAAHSDDEIETVFAHELAHHVHGDIWSALALETAIVTLGLYIADRVLQIATTAGTVNGKHDIAGLPLIVLTIAVVSIVCAPLANVLSRAHERRADRFALEATRNSTAFINAMRRLAAANLAEERPPRLVELLFHTHPSTAERIEAARTWASQRAAG